MKYARSLITILVVSTLFINLIPVTHNASAQNFITDAGGGIRNAVVGFFVNIFGGETKKKEPTSTGGDFNGPTPIIYDEKEITIIEENDPSVNDYIPHDKRLPPPPPLPPPPNEEPTKPEVSGSYDVYANQEIIVTARSTDAEDGGRHYPYEGFSDGYTGLIKYEFVWDSSRDGRSRRWESPTVEQGVEVEDSFYYTNRDVGYTYTCKVIARDIVGTTYGSRESEVGYYSFKLLLAPGETISTPFENNVPAPDLPDSSDVVYGSQTGETDVVSSLLYPEASTITQDNSSIVIIAIIAIVLIVLSIWGYKIYKDKYPFQKQAKKAIYHTSKRLYPIPKHYDYRLGLNYQVKSYRRPVKKKVKW